MTGVTITPGKTRREINQLLHKQGVKGSYFAASRHSHVLNPHAYGAPAGTRTLEGFLFPDTYQLRVPINVDMLVNDLRASQSKAYYVIGNEDVLIKKGIIVKEGGANLLIARVGRTLVPARNLDRDMFTAIDTRQVHEIEVPDSSRSYQIVSRQSLDDADALQRDGPSFRGNLKIKDQDKFWAPSKYLIIVER